MRKLAGKIYRNYTSYGFQGRIDCMRASPYWKREGVIFIHVPKSAGMSISTALYGKALGHVRAHNVRGFLPGVYESCFKFAFVRDPLFRYLSAWKFMQENFNHIEGGPGLPSRNLLSLDPIGFAEEFLFGKNVDTLNYIFKTQNYFLCDDGEILVDYIARYEKFNEEAVVLSDKVPAMMNLPVINASGSKKVETDLVELDKVIRCIYSNDYRLFGY